MRRMISLFLTLLLLLGMFSASAETTDLNHLSTQFVETTGIDAYAQTIADENDFTFASSWYTFDDVRQKTLWTTGADPLSGTLYM